jgi:2-polyprenyl-3-methyl-5-hydroxy-6-metoxy-1,4-benzoquinol methylase
MIRTKKNNFSESEYYKHQAGFGGLVSSVSMYARQKMYQSLVEMVAPTEKTTVLDVGVTCDRRTDSNFFEKLYPYSHNITAVGLEDASFLEQDHPGLTFIQADGSKLPFPDQSFDLVVCFAVIEHVGDRAQQRAFVQELCRVGRACFITTPNRWYPIEFHTTLLLVHWLPPAWFRQILKWLGKDFWASEKNLNLLSEKEVLSFFPQQTRVYTRHFRLLGPISNLVFYVEN